MTQRLRLPAPVAWVGFVAAVGAGIGLAAAQATSKPILGARWSLLDLIAVWAGVWAVGVACALQLPLDPRTRRGRRLTVLVILAAGTCLRLASLAGPPTLSDDLYRYSWDARIQLSGTDPYRYPPDAAALRHEREPWLWPSPAGCRALHRPPGCTRMNRPPVRTIYPPVAEAWFTAVYAIGGGIHQHHKLWQVAGVLTEVATMALLAVALARRGIDRRWLALYALSPAPAIEFVNNGHVDGLAVLLLVAAFAVLGREPPSTRRAAVLGLLIGLAALVKLYPAFALLPLWVAPGVRWRQRWASGATFVAVAVAGYAPHVAAVGVKVVGYLPGYLKEEHYTGTSTRFLLVDLLHLPGHHTGDVVVGLVIAAAIAFLIVRRPEPGAGAVILLATCLLCATPVQPWYGVSLLALATLVGRPRWALVVAAGYPYFFAVIVPAHHQEAIGQVSFGVGLVLALVAAGAFGLRRRGDNPTPA